MIRRLRAAEWAFDAALACLVVVVALPFIWGDSGPVAGLATMLLSAGGVVLRRAAPPLALAAVALGAVVQMATLSVPGPVNVAQLFVLYACAAFGSRRMRRISLGAAVLGAIVATAYIVVVLVLPFETFAPDGELDAGRIAVVSIVAFGFLLAILVCAWLLGLARHLVLRAREAALAQRIAQVQADRDRELVAIELERGRVAREMHDVLAHSLVSISMLADGTRVSVRSDPDEAEDLARTIGDVARESVTDVRRLLAELRHGQSDGAAPTIADLPEAIGRVEVLGLDVDRVDTGEPEPLTPGASLAVYRVVSECLTNALRHGDARTPVRLALEWRPGALRVTVRNAVAAGGAASAPTDTPADADAGARPAAANTASVAADPAAPAAPTAPRTTPIPRGGHGLVGIRERVLLEAGTLEVRREPGEFVVAAVLPTGTGAANPLRASDEEDA